MSSGIMKIILNNFWYKVSALGIAIVIWSVVQGDEIVEVNRRLTVNLVVPEGYMIRGEPIRTKDITLRFPRFIQSEVANKPLEAEIRLPKKPGELRFRVDKEYIRQLDSRVKLTVHDAYIVVYLDEATSKTVPIREVLQGAPAEGFIIEKVTLKPATVTVTGLKSELHKINEVVTEVTDINGLRENKTIEANVVVNGLTAKTLSDEKVQMTLQVGDSKINQRFENIPVEIQGNDFLAAVKPKFVSIVIQGKPNVLNFVKRSDLQAFVEIRGLTPGKYQKEIQVKIPPDTVLIETFPDKGGVEVYNQKKIN